MARHFPDAGPLHFSHVETLRGHDTPGADDVLVAEPEHSTGFNWRSQIGFELRPLAMARQSAIPTGCNRDCRDRPRTALARAKRIPRDYLKQGGRLVMLIDPQFPSEAAAKSVCDPAGRVERAGHRHRPLKPFSH